MRDRLSIVRSSRSIGLRAVVEVGSFGFLNYTTASFPDRYFSGLDAAQRPPSVLHGEAELDVDHVATPLDLLLGGSLPTGSAWPTETRRSLRRLEVAWLLTGDRFRLLDASPVEPLAHQASLVEHVLQSPELQRVLIADEVGLGKTVEAGLIIKRLAEQKPAQLRVLYLTEARLVRNVIEEFERLGLQPREWSAQAERAILEPERSDPLVVASIHRAVVNMDQVGSSGPWDVIVVDEAHHLSDWSPDGTDPQQRMRLCRRLIRDRLVPGGRVLLLSGTPHQGSEDRFKNLLRLLDEGGEATGAKGRVIYRIKDDIRDWDGEPLFPKRRVNPPIEIDAGQRYSEWLESVHELLTPGAGSRAAGWRRAQALQWCASSPQAGLAYLVRLALRSGLTRTSHPVLRQAMAVLRPYRDGSPDEPIEVVESRLLRSNEFGEEAEDVFRDPSRGLTRVLDLGVQLVQADALGGKLDKVFELFDASPSEKFVVFAQPVDTVYALKRRIEARVGINSVSLIVGGQDPATRASEIEQFREERRVLVSSRSGGEGINLQVARRLVHFDIPWNPMEMEQRVGRIHRYGSTDTVVVDALVLKDSREQRVLARSRARLGKIATQLDQDRMDVLFSRTMSLIPLEELAALMAGEKFGPLTESDEQRIDTLVTAGYKNWLVRDAEFRVKSEKLRNVDRGPVTEDDLRSFLESSGAERLSGWVSQRFQSRGEGTEPVLSETAAEVFQLPDSTVGYVGRNGGVGLRHQHTHEKRPAPLGLNHSSVAELVRQAAGETSSNGADSQLSGAGTLRVWRESYAQLLSTLTGDGLAFGSGALLLVYQRRQLDVGTSMQELSSELHGWLVSPDGTKSECLSETQLATLVRMTRNGSPKIVVPELPRERLIEFERAKLRELGRQAPQDPFRGVFPLLALWLEPALIKSTESQQ